MDDPGISISRLLRRAMGEDDQPGTCRDCGGMGVVPDMENASEEVGVWKDCPTCRGMRYGGVA